MQNLQMKIAALLVAIPAASFADFNTSYTINRPDNNGFEITNIFLLERGPYGGSGTWAFTVGADEPVVTLTNPFLTNNVPAETLMVGITHDLDHDAPGQKHLVLMMDDTAAHLSDGIGWPTLFRHTDEDQLIADVELASSGQAWPIIQPGLDGLGRFTGGYDDEEGHHPGDAEAGILDPMGHTRSAWFTFGGTFSVVAWSDGQIIAHGTSQTVPEPASLAVLGLGLVGLSRRRRR